MKILQISSIKNASSNGVVVALTSYLKYESKYAEVALYNVNTNIIIDNINCYSNVDYKTISSLPNGFNNPDIVVFNEVYKKEYIKLYKECLKNNIPYVIIPHGCLVKLAQKKKYLKKKIGNLILFNRFVKKSSAIQYLNKEEQENSVFKVNYIISGNGVEIPSYKNKYTNLDLIYIGRYAIYHKGLDILVNVCNKYKSYFIKNNIKVKLYGRTRANDIDILNNMITKYELNDVISINKEVYGSDKEQILKNAYAFIQLSRHEGQPMGVMEALSIGLPTIVTYNTTFGDFVNNYNAGIGVNIDDKEIFNAIKKIYEDKNLRNEYSENAYIYMNKLYNFDNVIKDLIEKYEKIRLNK